jgi:transposase
MAFRYGDRNQTNLFPPSLDDLVPDDSPVRVYNAFIDALDLSDLGIVADENGVGNPSYDPRAMLKLLVYGYSYGVRSSRKLEREVNYNVSFMWLMGGLKPDHKTIAEFRRRNKKALRNVLKFCARICIKLDLISGNTLFVDGSKFRANASRKNMWTARRCEAELNKIDRRINAILDECDKVDSMESGLPSFVKIQDELKNSEVLRSKIRSVLDDLETSGKNSVNTVDKDCAFVGRNHYAEPGYNAQLVIDNENGLIISNDVVSESNDMGQLSSQLEQAHETMGNQCETVCADCGYNRPEELEKISEQGIKVIVPSIRQAAKPEEREFTKKDFKYDKENNIYICPQGQILNYRKSQKSRKSLTYRITSASICKNCSNWGTCTKDKRGRAIWRMEYEELRNKFETEYKKPESQKVYRLRQQRAEHPFGHIKRNLMADHFLIRGLDGVKAEMSILATCFNLRRMMTIVGIALLKEILSGYSTNPAA